MHYFQSEFCRALEGEESSGTKFTVDRWRRHNPSEGGGITCVIQDGETFEKAGVNITVMSAPLSKQLQASMRARSVGLGCFFIASRGQKFFYCRCSFVLGVVFVRR